MKLTDSEVLPCLNLMKTPECKHCGGEHYSLGCFKAPRKPIQTRTPLQRKKPLPSYTKPLQKPRKRIKQQSSNPRPVAVKELDRVFSIYIRKRDEGPIGFFRCCSCGKLKHISEADAGHYISRQKMALRWYPKNVHAECRTCNRGDPSHLIGYTKFLKSKYGEDIIDEFNSIITVSEKLSIVEINEMANRYRKLLTML